MTSRESIFLMAEITNEDQLIGQPGGLSPVSLYIVKSVMLVTSENHYGFYKKLLLFYLCLCFLSISVTFKGDLTSHLTGFISVSSV